MDYTKDYYSILGVGENATSEEISSAYKKLMKKWHPDMFTSKSAEEQKEATSRSAEINEAYEVLSDQSKRTEYDNARRGGGGFDPFDGFSPFGSHSYGRSADPPNRFDRTPHRGSNISISVKLPFEDFFFGCSKTVEVKVKKACSHCHCGTVGGEAKTVSCPSCHGTGMITISQNYGGMTFINQMHMCPRCTGTGIIVMNACSYCFGTGISAELGVETLKFEIPKGTYKTRWSATYPSSGHVGIYGGENGDISVTAELSNDGLFTMPTQEPNKLMTIHHISYFKAMSGGFETIMTPYGPKTVSIPSGMKNEHVIKFNGMGLKNISDGVDGDLYVMFVHELPVRVDDEDRKMMGELADRFELDPSKFTGISNDMKKADAFMERAKA